MRGKNKISKIPDYFLKNIENIEEYFINTNKKRKFGISGVARLYNSGEFLEKVIDSWIDVYDEIILVNNNSTDNTAEICKILKNKYPSKIKIYNYPFDVHKACSIEHKNSPANSIHNLSYYYNWCYSKVNFQIIGKIDDDDLLNHDFIKPNKLRELVLNIKKNEYLEFSGFNVIKKNNKYYKIKGINEYAGFIGDHGFHYYSENTYCDKNNLYEVLQTNHLKHKWIGFIYIHLKFLKKDFIPKDNNKFTDLSNKNIPYSIKYTKYIDNYLHKILSNDS